MCEPRASRINFHQTEMMSIPMKPIAEEKDEEEDQSDLNLEDGTIPQFLLNYKNESEKDAVPSGFIPQEIIRSRTELLINEFFFPYDDLSTTTTTDSDDTDEEGELWTGWEPNLVKENYFCNAEVAAKNILKELNKEGPDDEDENDLEEGGKYWTGFEADLVMDENYVAVSKYGLAHHMHLEEEANFNSPFVSEKNISNKNRSILHSNELMYPLHECGSIEGSYIAFANHNPILMNNHKLKLVEEEENAGLHATQVDFYIHTWTYIYTRHAFDPKNF